VNTVPPSPHRAGPCGFPVRNPSTPPLAQVPL
jgi:hypothetical protein